MTVFTTGQVARFFHCAPNTVKAWCNEGWLPHWKVPEGVDRRIDAQAVLALINNMEAAEEVRCDFRRKLYTLLAFVGG